MYSLPHLFRAEYRCYVVTVGTFGAARTIDRCRQRARRADTNALGPVSVTTCLPVLDVMSLPWSEAEELV
jgi:hypothetical protein